MPVARADDDVVTADGDVILRLEVRLRLVHVHRIVVVPDIDERLQLQRRAVTIRGASSARADRTRASARYR